MRVWVHTCVCVYLCIYWYSALCKLFRQHCPLSVYRILYFTEMSVQGVDKRVINVHYYYYWSATFTDRRLLVYSHAQTMIPASKLRPLFADIFLCWSLMFTTLNNCNSIQLAWTAYLINIVSKITYFLMQEPLLKQLVTDPFCGLLWLFTFKAN